MVLLYFTRLLERKSSYYTYLPSFKLVNQTGNPLFDAFRLGMDYLKSVVQPIKQVAPRSSLKGLVDDYAHLDENVVLLEGETHLNRKPVRVLFQTMNSWGAFPSDHDLSCSIGLTTILYNHRS